MKFIIKQAAETEKVYNCRQIFFAKSKYCPVSWFFDHVGFVDSSGRLVQISTHRREEGVYALRLITQDSAFAPQDPDKVNLPKPVKVPSETDQENCAAFVASVLLDNNIKIRDTDLNKIFKMGLKYIKSPLIRANN
jgi:hypothetical protein